MIDDEITLRMSVTRMTDALAFVTCEDRYLVLPLRDIRMQRDPQDGDGAEFWLVTIPRWLAIAKGLDD